MSVQTLRRTGRIADTASSVLFTLAAVAIAVATAGLVGA
jgi:hypothetical protein